MNICGKYYLKSNSPDMVRVSRAFLFFDSRDANRGEKLFRHFRHLIKF